MQLVTLNDREVSEYIASLDLTAGSEAYRTMNALLLLPKAAFVTAISAMAQGLVTFADVRALSAMNARLMEDLVASRMGADDVGLLAWRYKTEWLPASVNVGALRTGAIGDAFSHIANRQKDIGALLVRPEYDFLRVDELRFHSFLEAYTTYMIVANEPRATSIIEAFRGAHAAFRAAHPDLCQARDEDCPVLASIERLLTTAALLEDPKSSGPGEIVSQLYRGELSGGVAPWHFTSFMDETAYPTMAAHAVSDPERSGMAGALAVRNATLWGPLPATDLPRWLAGRRMARVHLPAAYGVADEADAAIAEGVTVYLEAARSCVVAFASAVAEGVAVAAIRRRVTGSPVGLLLALTTN